MGYNQFIAHNLRMEHNLDTTASSTKERKHTTNLPDSWKLVQNDYKLAALIGSGAYGKVVKAIHRKSGKTVAIKQMDNIFHNVYDSIKLVREVQIMRHLTQMNGGKHTVQLYDVILDQEMTSIFLVMEYVPSDFKNVLRKAEKIKLEQEQILVLIYKMLCAVQFLHSANIMHRDIKPANILVDQDCNVKICDFGLSRSLV